LLARRDREGDLSLKIKRSTPIHEELPMPNEALSEINSTLQHLFPEGNMHSAIHVLICKDSLSSENSITRKVPRL
jgi:hypothetical protein